MVTLRDFVIVATTRNGMKARSVIWGNKPLVPLYMIRQIEDVKEDLAGFYRDTVPKEYLYEFLEMVEDDKNRKELRALLDKVYKRR